MNKLIDREVKELSVWDFSKPSPLIITFWILIAVIVLVLIGIIIRNLIKRKPVLLSFSRYQQPLKDLALELQNYQEFELYFNVVFKNKFAKQQFSQIPLLVFFNNNLFLISAPIKVKKHQTLQLTAQQFLLNNKLVTFDHQNWNALVKWAQKFEPKQLVLLSQPCRVQNNTDTLQTLVIWELLDYLKNCSKGTVSSERAKSLFSQLQCN